MTEDIWVNHPDYPGLRRVWSANSLRTAMQCWRLHYYKTVCELVPRPQPGQPPSPHTEFGTMWHGCAEYYDRERSDGIDHETALNQTIAAALELSWDDKNNKPWGGEVMTLWTCTGVETSAKGRRKFLCDAARDEFVFTKHHDGIIGPDDLKCPKCARSITTRVAYVPHHQTKNRLSLLRAVLAYCDDQAQGGFGVAKLSDGTPALEIEFELELPRLCPDGRPYVVRGVLDRVTEFQGAVFPHERKTTSRNLGRAYWGGFSPDPQVDTYDWAADQMHWKHDGVIVEAVQVLSGGARVVRTIINRGPESRQEWEDEVIGLLVEAENRAFNTRKPGILNEWWPRNTSACRSAAGGSPCEFRDVCAAAPSTRARMLDVMFEKRVRETEEAA